MKLLILLHLKYLSSLDPHRYLGSIKISIFVYFEILSDSQFQMLSGVDRQSYLSLF